MAFGRSHIGRLPAGLAGLALLALLGLAQPASAQQARVPVTGLPGFISADLRRLLAEETKPASLFEARRQADRAALVVSRLMESEGYYQAEVEPSAEGVDTFTREVRVTPGPLFIVGSARIEIAAGADVDPTTRKELDSLVASLAVGLPARAQPVLETQNGLLLRLHNAGYPEAKSDPVDALADGDAHTMDFTFRLDPGRRASFGGVVVSGAERTRLDFIEALRPWKRGDLVEPLKMDTFRQRLAETGIFASTTVKLAAASEAPDASGLEERDVDVQLSERKRRTIAFGASASTSEGVGVTGEWDLRNLSGMGDGIAIVAKAATIDSSLETDYTVPAIGGHYSRNLKLFAKLEDQETDAFSQSGGTVGAGVEQQLTHRLKGAVGVNAGYASIADDATRLAGGGREDLYILGASNTVEYVGVRDILDPKNGIRARLAVEPGVTFGDSSIAFAKITGEGSAYFDLGSDALVAALRGKVGSIIGPNGVPPDRLFFAGGGGSVRGYDYQSLSPRDSTGALIGGRSLVETSAELRWRASQTLGYVAFIDAGAAGGDIQPPVSHMRAGAGVGIRYYAGFGPLRADIATPLDRQPGDSAFQLYISIGQAF